MDQAEMQAEIELVAELQSLSAAIQRDVLAGAGSTAWKLRREQIAALRERVSTMRDRHLAGATPANKKRGGSPRVAVSPIVLTEATSP
jgi:hypothetical protein